MDIADHQTRAALQDQTINTLMTCLTNQSSNVKYMTGMVDALEITSEEINRIIKELKSKDNTGIAKMEVHSTVMQPYSKMTDILKKMKESLKMQYESLLKTLKNMRKEIEKVLDEKMWKGRNPLSEKRNGENNTKERETERTLTKKIQRPEEEVDNLKKGNQAIEAEKGKMRDDNQDLRTVTDRLSSRPKSHEQLSSSIQLFYQRKGGMIDSVEKELTSILKGYLHANCFERCERIGDINPNKILLVLCINASRLGTEAANAIEGIQRPENTVLLVFHHKDAHALTRLETTTSKRSLLAQCFKELGGIFDLAFQSDKGIYHCKMNENSICEVVSFIRLHTGMK